MLPPLSLCGQCDDPIFPLTDPGGPVVWPGFAGLSVYPSTVFSADARLFYQPLAFHFWLLGESSACGLMALAASRYLLAIVTTSQRGKGGFLCASVLCSGLTWQHTTDIFPLAGSLFMTIAAFQPTAAGLRLITLGGSLCWLINNVLAGSPMAIAMESTFMLSTLVSYWRLKRGVAVGG